MFYFNSLKKTILIFLYCSNVTLAFEGFLIILPKYSFYCQTSMNKSYSGGRMGSFSLFNCHLWEMWSIRSLKPDGELWSAGGVRALRGGLKSSSVTVRFWWKRQIVLFPLKLSYAFVNLQTNGVWSRLLRWRRRCLTADRSNFRIRLAEWDKERGKSTSEEQLSSSWGAGGERGGSQEKRHFSDSGWIPGEI